MKNPQKTWAQVALEHALKMQNTTGETRHIPRAEQMKNHPAGKRR